MNLRLWLRGFVGGVVRDWPKQVDERRENPSRSASIARSQTGKLGEWDVQGRLDDLGYVTVLSPGSRTMGDVWGVGLLDPRTIHLVSIQSKATATQPHPKRLRDDEIDAFCELHAFFDRRLMRRQLWDLDHPRRREKLLPELFRERDIITSIGYAGVNVFGESSKVIKTSLERRWMIDARGEWTSRQRRAVVRVHSFTDAVEDFEWRRPVSRSPTD